MKIFGQFLRSIHENKFLGVRRDEGYHYTFESRRATLEKLSIYHLSGSFFSFQDPVRSKDNKMILTKHGLKHKKEVLKFKKKEKKN